ncbi:hypothetical protein MNBD_GAMMA25-1380 [hydrothermal vent metagenome]|uniref:Uncharacterized protein n=1 Tax=hydrothermal vent metagenome TaxID=652676 RepID=A0A3B1BIR8_9ZZZZ
MEYMKIHYHAYRMARRGDRQFSRALVKLALMYIKSDSLLPPGLKRFFLLLMPARGKHPMSEQ